jgi:hypothetical protein
LQKKIQILKSCLCGNNGGRSSMVEPQIVVLVVAGSSPVGHPALQIPKSKSQASNPLFLALDFGTWVLGFAKLCL